MFANTNNGYSLADIAAATNNNGNDNAWGNGSFSWIWVILIIAIFGWGGNGRWGNNGSDNSSLATFIPAFQGTTTRSDITESFAMNNLDSGIRSIQNGICDSTYALSNTIQNGFANTNTAMLQGFNNANVTALQGFNGVQQGFQAASAQLAGCCCENKEAIANLNYNLASQECATRETISNGVRDIIENANANARAILDAQKDDTIQSLREQLQTANFQLSQQAQSANLLNQLRPFPIPSYITCSPYTTSSYIGTGCAGCAANY